KYETQRDERPDRWRELSAKGVGLLFYSPCADEIEAASRQGDAVAVLAAEADQFSFGLRRGRAFSEAARDAGADLDGRVIEPVAGTRIHESIRRQGHPEIDAQAAHVVEAMRHDAD